jgi:hypothetical protein
MRRLVHENTDHSAAHLLKRPSLRLAVLLVVVAAAFAATAGGAAATTPCGVKVIDDWYGHQNGQLAHTYPLHCYQDAIKIIGSRPDFSYYTNAKQDILFAMQLAIAHRKLPPGGGTAAQAYPDVLPSWHGGPDARNSGHAPNGVPVAPLRPHGQGSQGPVEGLLHSSSASSVPLPAIVLGAVAALLLILGSVAYLARRRQLRRETLRPQTDSGAQSS